MTKSQNTKNEQQNDLCITSDTLTEQWKKGELPSGRYWVKMSYKGAIIPLYYSEDYGFEYDDHFFDFEEVSEILAEVPSYDEIVKMEEEKRWYSENLHASTDKINELKELLKEIRESIAESQLKLTPEGFNLITEIVAKIDEVLK